METNPTMQDMEEFIRYLHNCSDPQVRSVYCEEEKKAAKRGAYAALAASEANSRNIKL
jgi:hypothetical protein